MNEINCDFNVGDMNCYVDASGTLQCLYNEGGVLDDCVEFEENPDCGFISSQCVGRGASSLGTCHVNEETWDCGTNVAIDDLSISHDVACAGPEHVNLF